MSIKSQEGHMRQLALLLTTDLGCIFDERESGPNGSKKAFLNVGKVFLRALAKDLGLHEVTVSANSGGIAVSGTCSLYGMWEDRGIAVWIEQRLCADGKVLCYRTIRSSRDFKGGYNHFLTSSDLKTWSYPQLLETLSALRKDGCRYRWLSSRNLPSGTRSYSWVHVTGNTQSKRAFLTEGPLKGDVASFLAQDALFICIGGVNALNGLNDTVRGLGVREVVEAMDMDQMTNPNVRNAILTMRKEVRKIPGIRYSKYTWNPAYKGVDDYLLSQAATM